MGEKRLALFQVWVEARMAARRDPAAVNNDLLAPLITQIAAYVATEMVQIERTRAQVTPREDWRELEQAAQLAFWSRVLGRLDEGEKRQSLAVLLDRLVGLS